MLSHLVYEGLGSAYGENWRNPVLLHVRPSYTQCPSRNNPFPDGVFSGHAISIVSFISPERQAASKDFLRWLAQDSIQAEWAALSGTTCNTSVLESEAFLSGSPINAAYAETLGRVRDFWNDPLFAELLEISQKQLHNFVIERTDPAQKIVDNIAEFQTQILQQAAEGSQ